MKELYVPSTEFENQDDPFLYLDSGEQERIIDPILFPNNIELKGKIRFDPIESRPRIKFSRNASDAPLFFTMYQSRRFYKRAYLTLEPVGWSQFEDTLEPFQNNFSYSLISKSCVYSCEFQHIHNHCTFSANTLLPCGVPETQNPAECILWYFIPTLSGIKKITPQWKSCAQYDPESSHYPLHTAIYQKEILCQLKHGPHIKDYRSTAYKLKDNTLWITFISVKDS